MRRFPRFFAGFRVLMEIEQNFIKSLYLDHNYSHSDQADDSDIEDDGECNSISNF